jgi:hypothetical protein
VYKKAFDPSLQSNPQSSIITVDFRKKQRMVSDHSTSTIKGSFVDKLSPHDSSLDGMIAKLTVMWTGFFAGIGLSDLFTLASLVYVLLNIFVLVRDKIVKRKADILKSRESDTDNGNLSSGD